MAQDKVLVTGANGFLGRRTSEMLLNEGFLVRGLVRKHSRIDNLQYLGAELFLGDVADANSMEPAFEGIDYVVHTAADTSGTEQGAQEVTIEGTRNILDLCISNQIKKLVYISSCSVYGPADYQDGQIIDENASFERFPEQRGIYSWAKLEAEKIVLNYMAQDKVSVACLRPGTIYGPGGENFSPIMGFSLGNKIFAVIKKNQFFLPLIYIDNLVQAIIASILCEQSIGQVYNVIDSQQVDKKQYMDSFIRKLYPKARFLNVPYGILSAAVCFQEKIFRMLKKKPVLTKYRLISSQKPIIYDSSKIMNHLGWESLFSFNEAVDKIIEYEKTNHGC